MADQADLFCNEINLPETNDQLSWVDAVSPNFMTKVMTGTSFQAYKPYFERRCLTHVYIDAINTVIALQRYKLLYKQLPEDLEILVPNYLKRVPIDYFDGSTLRYSKENGWLYSIGTNLNDDGGSLDSFIESDNWRKNPTIPISGIIIDEPK